MIVEDDMHNVTILHNLIRKVCSGSTSVVVDDVVGTVLKVLCNFLLNHEDNNDSLPKYMESSDYKFEVLKAAGFSFTTTTIRDSYNTEL